jgi:hypothetical protein
MDLRTIFGLRTICQNVIVRPKSPLTREEQNWLIFAPRFDSGRMILISSSQPMKTLFNGDRVDFKLRAEPTFALTEIPAVDLAMWWCHEL